MLRTPLFLDLITSPPVSDLDPVPTRRNKTHPLWKNSCEYLLGITCPHTVSVLCRPCHFNSSSSPGSLVTELGHGRALTQNSKASPPHLATLLFFHFCPVGLVLLSFLTGYSTSKSLYSVHWQGGASILLLHYKVPFQAVGRSFAGCEKET